MRYGEPGGDLPAIFLHPEGVREAPRPAPTPTRRRRRRLHELEPGLLCSVVGTCLDGAELRAVARRHGLAGDAFAVHRRLVREAAGHGPIGRHLQRLFERKFEAEVRRFAAARDAHTLRRLWHEAVAQGRIAGAYWALLTHPLSDGALAAEAHGEVHMLSHAAGAAASRRLREAAEVEGENARLRRLLARQRARARARLAERDRRIAELEGRLAAREAELARLRTAPAHPAAADAGRALARLRRRVASLEARLARRREAASAPAAPVAAPTPAPPGADAPAPGLPRLDGRRILYVGGRPRVVARLRRRIAAARGELLHHDGGVEEALERLSALVAGCDLVVCPVDCVSHNACHCLKRLCRREGKPVLFLRSSGDAAFLRTLAQAVS
ncbi:DUF2325 domain-containing protein [Inmirania thermothiophila]|uniref:Uncharacterized protein DUF2325 n=1 Tax=Inmirania thermothiophila TaxID=1750597 RepID=A0A3N1Y737_9GAMM|nr:DUF2325 domain-containing protein [Inmirania thermothiophila]ROR34560.1 uncharacterized protein DUF2325 [Inmirania thermothiophila]